jgi:hypothetical protein
MQKSRKYVLNVKKKGKNILGCCKGKFQENGCRESSLEHENCNSISEENIFINYLVSLIILR